MELVEEMQRGVESRERGTVEGSRIGGQTRKREGVAATVLSIPGSSSSDGGGSKGSGKEERMESTSGGGQGSREKRWAHTTVKK